MSIDMKGFLICTFHTVLDTLSAFRTTGFSFFFFFGGGVLFQFFIIFKNPFYLKFCTISKKLYISLQFLHVCLKNIHVMI